MDTIIQKLKQKKPPKKKEDVIIKLKKVVPKKLEQVDVDDTGADIDDTGADVAVAVAGVDTYDVKQPLEKPLLSKINIIDKQDSSFDRNALLMRLHQQGLLVPKIDILSDEKAKTLAEEAQQSVSISKPITPKVDSTLDAVDAPEVIKVDKPKKKAKKKAIIKLVMDDDVDADVVKDVKDDKEEVIIIPKPKPKTKKRITKPVDKTIIKEVPIEEFKLGDEVITERIIKPKQELVLSSAYYMNNREIFIQFINSLLHSYREEIAKDKENLSCENRTGDFSLLTHQKIVRDYINTYTPYRGTLLYHGLGSGKTCSSIVIAEGLKTEKQIIIMTPASLQMNYKEELKYCGDRLYKRNQYWEFVSVEGKADIIKPLSDILNLNQQFIKRKKGAWLVNMKKESNYNTLTTEEKDNINEQINKMIESKYTFINYNGLRIKRFNEMTEGGKINPFDNKVIVIDEVHNFISRIVNKLSKQDTLSVRLYEGLMNAENCRIVLLTGTPIINYPNEIGVLFNILRGYIKTWSFVLNVQTDRKIDESTLKTIFKSYAILDTIEYSPRTKTLVITRNPFGYINSMKKGEYKGVKVDERGQIDDTQFEKFILSTLKKNDIEVIPGSIKIKLNKALPDDLDSFKKYFIEDDGKVKNMDMFKRRILGLTSYLSDMDALLPKYDENKDFHEVIIPMSDFQFGIYEQARQAERKQETQNAKKRKKVGAGAVVGNVYGSDTSSTYRIFSRAFCNFVFPNTMKRPMPKDDDTIENAIEKLDEDVFDAKPVSEIVDNPDGRYTEDDTDAISQIGEETTDTSYEARLNTALRFLKENETTYLSKDGLTIYSPKFLNVLENIEDSIQDDEKDGLHLIYSQFRTLEGIGIMKLVLEANGFTQFKITKDGSGIWRLNIPIEERGKPTFVLYTGTESPEEKEIIRNIFNSTWGSIPSSLLDELRGISSNNFYGEIIKIIMITASGAEGISLRNVRYVHIIEPYWHPVRTEQVIGRARRICSHEDLPIEKRNIEVFMYLMTFTESQKSGEKSIELRLKDTGKLDSTKSVPLTSDEALYEISNIKHGITKQLMKGVKESAFDCAIHLTGDSKEKLVCFNVGVVGPDTLSFSGNYESMKSSTDKEVKLNKEKITWVGVEFTLKGKKYILKKGSDEVYDYDSYIYARENIGANPTFIGKLVRDGKKAFIQI